MTLETEMRRGLVAAVQQLEQAGMNQGSSGNVSCRCGETFLITPTGARSATLGLDDIVAIDREGRPLGPGIPSSEWRMHLAIMLAVPQAGAVVHTHADACVALACARRKIPAFHYMIARFGGDDIPCAPYATFGSKALADKVVETLAGRSACLLANHGMIVHSLTIEKAVESAGKLETLARQYVLSLQCGEPVLLDAKEIDAVKERYRYYGVAPMPE